MRNSFRIFTVLCCLTLVLPLWAQQLQTIDHIYDPKIETVLLFPQVSANQLDPALTLNPPVISLDEAVSLQLEFDDLTANYRSFRARLVHCNADWQRSILNDIEFTYEYNDNPITDYQISINTKIPYYHYRFTLPRVKLPGNYVLVVYDERNRNNITVYPSVLHLPESGDGGSRCSFFVQPRPSVQRSAN